MALGSFALYAATAVPGPFDGDYGEFQYMPRLLGLPHPTGYPLYLLLGWLWSWLPLGTLAFRLNLFSALWAGVTLVLMFVIARDQRLKWIAAMGGALALALAPAFWRYAGLAAVYTLQTALLAAALVFWLRWSMAPPHSDRKWLWAAALFTGLSLTNHPTSAFLVPAAALFLLLHWIPWPWPRARSSPGAEDAPRRRPRKRLQALELLVAAGLFVLPGLLYLYVPLRACAIGPGDSSFGLPENIAKGRMAPYVACDLDRVIHYITGRSLLSSYDIDWSALWTTLPRVLVDQFGRPLALVGAIGSVLWLARRPRSWVPLTALFLPAAAYATTYAADFTARNQIAHLEGHLLPALLVFSLWIALGISSGIEALLRLFGRPRLVNGLAALLLGLAFSLRLLGAEMPTTAMRVQSQSIRRYWTEALSYPLEPEAALAGHWGDMTAFWYFQHGEGLRPDLWGIYPPSTSLIDKWLTRSGRALYLAGPVLDSSPDLAERYSLTPWGILVRIAPKDNPPVLPPMTARTELFGDQLQLEGYNTLSPAAGRRQLWLAWLTIAPTQRDLSVSVRLHAPDGTLLLQEDGRLESPWFPGPELPAGQRLLTVFDLEIPDDLPPDAIIRIVVYDPETMQPLLTTTGKDVFEVGPLTLQTTTRPTPSASSAEPKWSARLHIPLAEAGW